MPEQEEPTHRVYIDDSGTKEYAADPQSYGPGNTRYFVFGAIMLATRDGRLLVPRLQAVKRAAFGTVSVEVKSNWLRMPKECEKRYLRPFGLTSDELKSFVDSYYEVLAAADFQFIAGVIDKAQMVEQYPDAWYAPAACYELVLQRVENELRNRGSYSIVIDDMTGATPKHSQYKDNLKRQHEQMKQRGSSLQKGFTFTGLRHDLKFVNSSHQELIQVADIAAYNVLRQFSDHGDAWEDAGLDRLPTYEYFARLLPKFRRGPEGRIQGFGVVKLPRRGRVHWTAQGGK